MLSDFTKKKGNVDFCAFSWTNRFEVGGCFVPARVGVTFVRERKVQEMWIRTGELALWKWNRCCMQEVVRGLFCG